VTKVVTAYCYGAATIVNGIATGKGAAFGIGLKTTAKVKLTNEPGLIKVTIEEDPTENQKLAEYCVKDILVKFDLISTYGAEVTTSSEIPISRGLKSSSAAANAIVLATFNVLGKEYEDLEVINIGIDAAFKAKVTLTGAFDDAAAAYFGNVVVTDNEKREILTQYPIDHDYDVIIHVPKEKIKKMEIDTTRLSGIKPAIEEAHALAMEKNFLLGIQINGLTYGTAMGLDTTVTQKAIKAGAVTAGISGTGPATVILAEPDDKDKIIDAIGSKDQIIVTKINREKAGIEK
jgi:shikimate kinase